MDLMNFAGITQFELKRLTFNLNIEYPPPYERLFWEHKKHALIISKKAIGLVNWDFLLNNKLSIDSQLSLLKLW